jgi:hypothetical protein
MMRVRAVHQFSDYVAEVEKGSKRARDQYLAVQNINHALPQIADDFVMPEFVPKLHRYTPPHTTHDTHRSFT